MCAMVELDYRYRRPHSSTWRIMVPGDPNTAYAYTEVRLRVTPTPQDITRRDRGLVAHLAPPKASAACIGYFIGAAAHRCGSWRIAKGVARSPSALVPRRMLTNLAQTSSISGRCGL
jgi:hypothetical protein